MTTRRELLKQSTTVAAMLASLGMYPMSLGHSPVPTTRQPLKPKTWVI